MDQVQKTLEPCKEFVKDSVRLVKRCTKPDRKGESKHGLNDESVYPSNVLSESTILLSRIGVINI